MQPRTLLPLLAAAAAVAAAPVRAQTAQSVPYHADLVDCQQGNGLPFGVPGFRTQILVDAAAIAPNGAALTGLRFRADRSSLPLAAASVPNVTVTLSQTNVAVGSASDTFATNITGPTTVVFQGTVNLPAYTDAAAGPLPWDIDLQFPQAYLMTNVLGNLLIDIVGDNPTGGSPSYYLDGTQAGGSATRFGRGGDNPTFDYLNLVVATAGGGGLVPRLISPGHSVEFSSTLSFAPAPGLLMLSTVGLPVGIDLGFLGAPTNFLYLDPMLLAPHSWTQSFIGWYSTVSLTVPNGITFLDATLYAQSLILEPTANALGIVLSHAVEVRIGSQSDPLPMQQIDALDPNAPAGVILDFGIGGIEFGAVPVRFEGAFF